MFIKQILMGPFSRAKVKKSRKQITNHKNVAGRTQWTGMFPSTKTEINRYRGKTNKGKVKESDEVLSPNRLLHLGDRRKQSGKTKKGGRKNPTSQTLLLKP